MYNTQEWADSIIGQNVHVTDSCHSIDFTGIVEKYDVYNGEIIYIIKPERSGKIHIGANTKNLKMDIL